MHPWTSLVADLERPLDGVNLVPYVLNEKSDPPHTHIYLRMFDRGVYAMRAGNFKIVKPANVDTPRLFNLRDDLPKSYVGFNRRSLCKRGI